MLSKKGDKGRGGRRGVWKESAWLGPGAEEGSGRWWIYLYICCRAREGRGKGGGKRGPLAARALYYIIGGHFGPPKLLSEHKKYEVLLGPPFFRAASGAAPSDRTVTEKGGAKERSEEAGVCESEMTRRGQIEREREKERGRYREKLKEGKRRRERTG